jgi:hypothetical protein
MTRAQLWSRLSEIHTAVRVALEDTLTSREFLIGIRVWPVVESREPVDAIELATRVDRWLHTLDPDTVDASELTMVAHTPAATVNVHAIPRAVQDCDRRANPIVWNAEPLGLIVSSHEIVRPADNPPPVA